MTVLLLDNCTDTPVTRMASHVIAPTNSPGATWNENGGVWAITSAGTACYAFSSSFASPLHADVLVADGTLSATCTITSLGDFPGLSGRGSAGSDHWWFWIRNDTNKLELYERVGGSQTLRGQASYTVPTGTPIALSFVVSGTSVTALAGAASVNWNTSSALDANTKFGLFSLTQGSGEGVTWDAIKFEVAGGGGGTGKSIGRLARRILFGGRAA
jgi:hypothetical protein